ncbi:MAG TPA: PPC domain-containing DNA-binding protein [Longimicrobiaceae bacterium]|nr:PPC domain-containing DNA-binding protein [Longimicrobiaceae bacterium]
MQYREAPFGYFLVLDRGDEVLESVTRFATETGVRAASFTGIGAIGKLTLAFYDLETEQYEKRSWEQALEVASLIGNLAEVDGGPYPHIHGIFCTPDFQAFGGHVFEAHVSITIELSVLTAPDLIRRQPVDFCDLKLMDL